MRKVNKRQALAMAVLACGSACAAEVALADIARGRGNTLLVAEGCKLSARKRGCVTTYCVWGYAHDGSDVERCVARADRLIANVSGCYQHDGFDALADALNFDVDARLDVAREARNMRQELEADAREASRG